MGHEVLQVLADTVKIKNGKSKEGGHQFAGSGREVGDMKPMERFMGLVKVEMYITIGSGKI